MNAGEGSSHISPEAPSASQGRIATVRKFDSERSIMAIAAISTPTMTARRGGRTDDGAACSPDCRAGQRRAEQASRRQSANSGAADAADDGAACRALSGGIAAAKRQRRGERDHENHFPWEPFICESSHPNNLPVFEPSLRNVAHRLRVFCRPRRETSDRNAPIEWSPRSKMSPRRAIFRACDKSATLPHCVTTKSPAGRASGAHMESSGCSLSVYHARQHASVRLRAKMLSPVVRSILSYCPFCASHRLMNRSL